jgi:hypothetical protein
MPDQWAKDWTLSLQNWSKNELFRRFSEAKSHDAGEFGGEKFSQALISNGLKIICNVLRGIYTPWG